MRLASIGERRTVAEVRRFSSRDRFSRPGLTGLRALAAGWVLAFHLNELVGPRRLWADLGFGTFETTHLLTIGSVGVDIFFVLSGFLLTVHVLERRGEGSFADLYGAYLRGRILRVVPAYWAQIAFLAALAVAATGRLPEWIGTVPAHLVFLQNFGHEWFNAINGVYWTLPVEFSFYLVLPLVVVALCARGGEPNTARAVAVAAIAVAIAVAWRYLVLQRVADDPVYLRYWATAGHLPGAADQFGFGIAAAAIFRLRSCRPGHGRGGDLLAAAGLSALVYWMYFFHLGASHFWEGGVLYLAWRPVAGLCIAMLVYGVACGGPLARALFENPLVLWLGAISYSVYLWHLVIARGLLTLPPLQGHGVAMFAVIAVPAILAGSAASYYFVERPFLRRKAGTATLQ